MDGSPLKSSVGAVFVAAAAFLASTANAAEPPACSDRAVMRMVQESFWEQKLLLSPVPTERDGDVWRAYNEFTVSNVVSHGYDSGLKRRLCEGSIGKGQRPIAVPYTVQITESDPSTYIVRADFRAMPREHAIVLREMVVNIANKK